MAKAINLPQEKSAMLRLKADTAGQLAELSEKVLGALEEIDGGKQDKLTGAAGKLVGFNAAGEAGALTISSTDISAVQSGTDLTFALNASGATAGTFGIKPSVVFGCVWTSNNKGVNSSTAQTTLTAKQACTVSFDYSYSSETNYDKLTITVGGTTVANGLSGAATKKSWSGSVVSGGAIVFKYAKDGSQNVNDDCCTFSNLTVKIGSNAPVLLNSQNIGTYFTVTDGTYKFVPQDCYESSAVTVPVFTVDEKGRVTKIAEQEINLGAALHPHGNFTIPVSGWNSDSTADYPYYYDVVMHGVTADDRVDMPIAPASVSTAVQCGMCPYNESMSGKIRIRAAKIPAAAISAEYWIEKG